MTQKQNHTDIIYEGWVARVPGAMRPYLYLMRLDRPIGTWLLLLPALWGLLLAGGFTAWPTMILFAVGAVVMRGAGCVINDLWDRDLDGAVERTATRPLPNGDVTPRQALIFLGGLLSVGLVILLQFNALTIILGVISVAFIVTYPLMKRITWWPQAFLGLTFNFGVLLGWSAITGDLPLTPILIYIAGIFWTLGYDTIYALQDREDDAMVGIKSAARYILERGHNAGVVILSFYLIHFIIMTTAIVMFVGTQFSWGVALVILPLLHLIWQVKTLDLNDQRNALKRFKSNRDYGLIWCLVIIVLTAL